MRKPSVTRIITRYDHGKEPMNVTTPIKQPSEPTELEEARALIREKRFSEAIACLTPFIKSMRLDKPKPEEVFALLMMADAQLFNGQPADAYKNYVIASELDPKRVESLEKAIFQCIYEMREPILSPTFENHLIQYFDNTTIDNASLDRVSVKLLTEKFELDIEDGTIELSTILSDLFLPAALSNLVLADAKVELFLNQVRHHIFNLAIESDLADELQTLVVAFANHAERIEYAFSIEAGERVVLLGIKSLLETEIHNEEDLRQQLGPLLLYAMFEPIEALAFARKVSVSNLNDWPAVLQPLLKKTLIDRSVEQSLEDSIRTLATVSLDVSKAVMDQYEQNPYPRWENLFAVEEKVRYLELRSGIHATIRNPKKFNKHLDCLVAGSGTGRHPLRLAAGCRDIRIMALDLSLRSLCYAKRKSLDLEIDNIEFVQGDILELDSIEEKFDVIECSGVLHHMRDPEEGLQALVRRLRSHGLLRLGLYSRLARDCMGINRARVHNPKATLEDIRTTRAHELKTANELKNIPRDFYSTSECRDLLFHVQEHQYDILEIKALLERNDLEFLGFNPLHKDIQAAYKSRFGSNADFLNLNDWHIFEQENPLIFKSMYQFHCQKKP